ncbi:putative bifunctional diguanylate cyclase/phosphodiesterase [Sphingomonas glacialis]|uniref:EAL domain-containing protein n=1 Tax=Sphingomonas glacialis TaxID=658225 RepID=A0A502FYE4_9SPHN|nr:EAL domain-containing protein [Sphingomonas glacialis]TPG54499.1 EAL domain-containing protein [Sphingomonas glacialis]
MADLTSPRESLVVPRASHAEASPEWCVRADQLVAAQRSVTIALPINILLTLVCAAVAWHAGNTRVALFWLLASASVNAARALLQWSTRGHRSAATSPVEPAAVERQLRDLWRITLASGCVWAMLPLLCGLYTAPEALFFLAVGCGITAGAVSHGGAYARVPIAFITPPIVSSAVALIAVGGFDRSMLAATMAIYLAALVLTARRAEAAFRHASALGHCMAVLNTSLETAHASAQSTAEEMRYHADHDHLTGLLNRAGFLRAAAGSTRDTRAPTCLMLLDLDGFKAINDVFGHTIGDEVLVEVAQRLRRELPDDVLMGRWGGDEFAVLLAATPDDISTVDLADRLIAAVAAPYPTFGTVARVGMSVGVHVSHASDMPEMLACADLALYAAKSAGRNRCTVFGDDLRDALDLRRDIERDLPAALGTAEVSVWFQPIFGDGGTRIFGLEALVRWQHPTLGWIMPADLMATAAKAGFARPLMDLILDRVCAMITALSVRGLDHITVAMNVSPREMSQLPVDQMVLAALAERNLPPAALEIEITEETALDTADCARKLQALSQAGIRIAIDDFGIGYSSLSLLRTLKVDSLKIDRCFVSGLTDSAGDQVLVKAVLNLGQSLRIDVTAEGVESIEDLRMLRTFGCQMMQGYHLARPMPMTECLAFIADAEAQSLPPGTDGFQRAAG